MPTRSGRQMNREGIPVARCTVERLMQEQGLQGVIRGKKIKTTFPDPAAANPHDLVKRDFTADCPNQLWVADFTFVSTWQGFAYVAFIVDVFSRFIVGWRVSRHMRTEFVLDALKQRCMPGNQKSTVSYIRWFNNAAPGLGEVKSRRESSVFCLINQTPAFTVFSWPGVN